MRHGATLLAGFFIIAGTPALTQQSGDATGKDRISARIVATELEAMKYTAKIDKDENGDPRVKANVDGFEWAIYFYDCDNTPALEDRGCVSYQFYSGYNVPATFPLATINKWNTEKRYAKAYTYVQKDHTTNARIEIDVLMAGTGANPAQSFRTYFSKMQSAANGFRKAIGIQK